MALMAQLRVLILHRILQVKKYFGVIHWGKSKQAHLGPWTFLPGCAHKPRILKLLNLAKPPFVSHKRKTDTADQMIEVAKLSLYASWQQFRSIAVWLNGVFYTIYRFYVIWELLLHHSVQVHTLLRSISMRDFICRQATRIPNCSPLKAVSTKIVKIKRVCRKSTPKNGSVIQCKKHFSCLAEPHLALTLPGEASAWNYAVVLHVASTLPHWINIRICLPCLPASKLGTS